MLNFTPVFRLYARRRLRHLDRMDPVEAQRQQLLKLVRHAQDTAFGRAHGFAEIRSVADFQGRVPLRPYEDFWQAYWRDAFPHLAGTTWPEDAPYFAVTSGTSTGRTKYIPVTTEMARSNRRAGLELLAHHLRNRPNSRVLGGKNFMLSGSVDLTEEAPGILSGDLTGIAIHQLPRFLRLLAFPPEHLARERDWEKKIAILAEASLQEDIRTIAGTASWLLIYFDKLLELHPGPRNLYRFYPNLELVVHGGVNFAPYRAQFEEWIAGGPAELREAYPASEGFFAFADRATGEGMLLRADAGMFYEFVPLQELGADRPTRHWLDSVETDVDYALAVSTAAGLWSYLVGDTVRFVDRRPPRILMTGRTSYFLSAFGEHLTGEEIDDAVTGAAVELGASITDYSVGPLFPHHGKRRGGHLFIVEFSNGVSSREAADRFAATVDRLLSETNDDYQVHRAEDYGMDPPEVLLVAPGTFAGWMRARGKLGGQNKVPRVINDEALFAELREFASGRTVAHAPAVKV